jgi:Flp pilus assembly protein TadD
MRTIAVLALVAGCAGSQPAEEPPPPPSRPLRPVGDGPPGQAELDAAIAAAKSNDLERAIERAKAAIAANPQLEHAYLLYGSSCAMNGDAACELAAYEQGLGALPRSPALKKALGLHHLENGDAAQAVSILEEAKSLSPKEDPELMADLAYAYIFVDKVAEGEKLAEDALRLDAKCFQCAMALGEVRLAGKKFGPAAAAYAKASELEPGDPGPPRKLAKATYLAGNAKDGLAMYAAAVEKTPDDAELRFEYAKVLLDARRPKDAILHIQKLLEANADEPNLLKLLLDAQTKAKDKKGAEATKKRMKALGAKP